MNWREHMGPMVVYRVEDTKGGGPYNGPNKHPVKEALPHLFGGGIDDCLERHPMPQHDVAGWDSQRDYHFGFASMAQLENWFDRSERETLRRLGFGIALYTVADAQVLHGLHQVAFNKPQAKRARNRKALNHGAR